jgi:hypothetical protein
LRGISESDSSFFTPFVFLAGAALVDFRFFGLMSSSLSISFLAAFFGVAFFALLSSARIAFACFSAFFSIEAFCLASLRFRGSSSEDSTPNVDGSTFGGSLEDFFAASG